MRKRKRSSACGWAAVILGGFIFMALILPSGFWWMVCAVLLIYGGVWLLRY